jgi:hypothetical protein
MRPARAFSAGAVVFWAKARPVRPAIKAVAIKVVRIDFMETSFG